MDKSLISAKAPRGRDSRQVPVGLIKYLKENTCGLIFSQSMKVIHRSSTGNLGAY